MVDVLRAYRRWMLRRLAYLLPAFSLALGVNVWLAIGVDYARSLQVICLLLSGLSLGAIGWLLFETIACAVLHARHERRAARALRGLLAPSWRIAGACAFIFAVLICAPFLTRLPAAPAPREPVARRPAVEAPPMTFTQVLPEEDVPPALAAPETPPPPPPAPEIRPVMADVPRRLEIEERELNEPVALAPFLQAPQEAPRPAEPESLNPEALVFRPEPEPEKGIAPMGVDRLGLRDENSDELPAPALRFELFLVSMDEFGRGLGTNLEGDLAVSRDGSIRLSYLGVAFGSGELDEIESDWTWHRMTLGYTHRLMGFTRHASFDLSVSVGASVDRVQADDVDGRARVSPYAAVDVGIWEGGPFGFVLHAGHALPFNATGVSSSVSELSATLRLDLSERLSLFAGYRMLWIELKEYPGAVTPRHADIEFESALAGPLAGFELRF